MNEWKKWRKYSFHSSSPVVRDDVKPWWSKHQKSTHEAVYTSGFPHRRITRLITQHDSGPVLADKSDLLHRLGQSLSRTDAFANPRPPFFPVMPTPTRLPLFRIYESSRASFPLPRSIHPFYVLFFPPRFPLSILFPKVILILGSGIYWVVLEPTR